MEANAIPLHSEPLKPEILISDYLCELIVANNKGIINLESLTVTDGPVGVPLTETADFRVRVKCRISLPVKSLLSRKPAEEETKTSCEFGIHIKYSKFSGKHHKYKLYPYAI